MHHTRRASALERATRFMRNHPRVVLGGATVALYLIVAMAAPMLSPHDPHQMNPSNALESPSGRFWLGTDQYGRDVLSRLMYGGRISLMVGLAATGIGAGFGVILGMVAAYYKGAADVIIMRSMDLLLSFPAIILAIAAVAVLGSDLSDLVMVIGVLYIPRFARLAFSASIVVSNNLYVESLHSVGAKNLYIIRTAVLPNITSPILVQISISIGAAILTESGLSFLGLGTAPPTSSWGLMISEARSYMEIAPLVIVWPSIAIAACVLSFNMLGDGLSEMWDPRLRQR